MLTRDLFVVANLLVEVGPIWCAEKRSNSRAKDH